MSYSYGEMKVRRLNKLTRYNNFSLQSQKLERWKNEVTIVATDMRLWNAPEKADIMVSELLGSFSDNELSPECLDGAQNFLKGECMCRVYSIKFNHLCFVFYEKFIFLVESVWY